jgi:hypothetical protein
VSRSWVAQLGPFTLVCSEQSPGFHCAFLVRPHETNGHHEESHPIIVESVDVVDFPSVRKINNVDARLNKVFEGADSFSHRLSAYSVEALDEQIGTLRHEPMLH